MKFKVKKINLKKVRFKKDLLFSDESEIVFTFHLKKANESSLYLTNLKNMKFRAEQK